MSAHHQTAAATHRLAAREEAGLAHDKGEAFAREVFGRFLRQATICRDIDDVIEHMHIVNDNAQMFGIRLGGEARIPVAREQVLALASKKKELLALCKSPPRPSRPSAASGGGGSGSGSAGSGSTDARPQSFIFPPPTALATTGHDAPTAVVSRVNEAASTPVDAVAAVTVTGATEMLKAARKLEPALLEQPQPTAAYIPTSSSTSKSARARQNKAPTTVFVRKVDMRMEKDDLRRHFQQFGEVVAISMNPTRGYAFVDFTSHDDVIRAVSATDHQVGHRKLEVEVKKEVGSEQRKLSKSAPMMTGGSRATLDARRAAIVSFLRRCRVCWRRSNHRDDARRLTNVVRVYYWLVVLADDPGGGKGGNVRARAEGGGFGHPQPHIAAGVKPLL